MRYVGLRDSRGGFAPTAPARGPSSPATDERRVQLCLGLESTPDLRALPKHVPQIDARTRPRHQCGLARTLPKHFPQIAARARPRHQCGLSRTLPKHFPQIDAGTHPGHQFRESRARGGGISGGKRGWGAGGGGAGTRVGWGACERASERASQPGAARKRACERASKWGQRASAREGARVRGGISAPAQRSRAGLRPGPNAPPRGAPQA